MIKNYLLTTLKNLSANKFFTLLNVLGLAIGLCVFILVAFYVEKEFSYDTQWDNADRIYRMNALERPGSVNPTKRPLVPYVAAPMLQENFPDHIEQSARGTFSNPGITADGNSPVAPIWLFESGIIDIFSFDVQAGSLEDTMAIPSRIALSEARAIEYFGHPRPLGEVLSVNFIDGRTQDFEVTAIYRFPEGESIIEGTFDSLALLDQTALAGMPPIFLDWNPPHLALTYFLLSPNSDVDELNTQLNLLVDGNTQADIPDLAYDLELQAMTEAYFNANDNEQGGDKTQVLTFLLIGTLVLLLGIANYVILSTVSAVGRRKEAGIRKVAGARGGELVWQFLGESMLLTVIAMVAATMMAELTLPFFQTLAGTDITVIYSGLSTLAFLVLVTVVTGCLGGFYPAVILAKARPQEVLRHGGKSRFTGIAGMRNGMLAFQFTIAIALIIATLVMYFQLSFYKNRNHNFNAENLVQVELTGPPIPPRYTQKSVLVDEVKKLPGVLNATLSMREANDSSLGTPQSEFEYPPSGNGAVSSLQVPVGYDFFRVYQIPLLAGRSFVQTQDAPDVRQEPHVILNRYAATTLGFSSPEEALGKVLVSDSRNYDGAQVIGVVEDNQYLSYRGAVVPEIYVLNPVSSFFMTVRYQAEVSETIVDNIASVWRDVFGDEQFSASFVMQNLQAEFVREENEGKLLMTLSFLSIFIACLGLYGLVSFTLKGRVKEIGIRKVMGASVGSILRLFLWQFTRPVILANSIAWPLAAWGMSLWLQRFPYQVDAYFLIPLYLMAGLVALLIAWITVGATTAKSASQNPVHALRYE